MLGLIRGGFISDDKRTVVKIKQIASFSHKSATGMCEIKYTYFDLRVKGETGRLLLAFGGIDYTDERIEPPWSDPRPWNELKPKTPRGQLPMLKWKDGTVICQSMTICRFLAKEFGIAGRTNLEMALVDEVVDTIQDAILATYNAWNSNDKKQELLKVTEVIYPTMLSQLERQLMGRDNTWLVGDTLTWADLHLFFFCSEDFLEPRVVAAYPKIAKLVGKVGEVPSIKRWVETRPGNKEMFPGKRIYFQNAYKIVEFLE